MKIFLLFFLCFQLSSKESNFYIITSISENSDFDMKNFDKPPKQNSSFMISNFPIKKGNFKIIHYMNLSYGFVSYSNKESIIHHILSLKLDKNNKIIEAYHYNLEWQDSPNYNLYELGNKNIFFKENLNLSELNMLLKIDKTKLDMEAHLDNVYKAKVIK